MLFLPDYDRNTSPRVYYTLHVFLLLYGIAIVAGYILVLEANHPHTYTRGTGVPGTLYSRRYNSLFWFSNFFAAMRILTFVAYCAFLKLAKNADECFKFCYYFWVVILFLLVGTEIMGWSFLMSYVGDYNTLYAVDNPANDKRWCYVPAVRAITANGCSNTVGSVTLGELDMDPHFKAQLGCGTLFMLAGMFLLLFPLIVNMVEKTRIVDYEDDAADEELMGGGVFESQRERARKRVVKKRGQRKEEEEK